MAAYSASVFRPLSLTTLSPAATAGGDHSHVHAASRLSTMVPTAGGTGVGIGGVAGRAHTSPILSVFSPDATTTSDTFASRIDYDALATSTSSDAAPSVSSGVQRVPTTFIPRASQYYVLRCVPTERRVRFAFLLLVGTAILLVMLVGIYAIGMRRIRQWIEAKQQLKCAVKRLSRCTADVVGRAATDSAVAQPLNLVATRTTTAPISQNHGYAMACRADRKLCTEDADVAAADQRAGDDDTLLNPAGNNYTSTLTAPRVGFASHPSQHPAVLQWLAQLDAMRLGNDRRGFVFVVDGDGGVWAHGKARHLVGDARGLRAPGFHNMRGLDARQGDKPFARALRAAKRGGGFVHFLWKKERLMVAFACPVRGTDLVVCGAIPVPRNQLLWERQHAMQATAADANEQSAGAEGDSASSGSAANHENSDTDSDSDDDGGSSSSSMNAYDIAQRHGDGADAYGTRDAAPIYAPFQRGHSKPASRARSIRHRGQPTHGHSRLFHTTTAHHTRNSAPHE